MNTKKLSRFGFFGLAVLLISGCSTPNSTPNPIIINPDVVDHNPFGSAEIRACAAKIAPQMLMTPELNTETPSRIVVEPLRNSSSLRMDTNLITNSLKNELAQIAMAQGTSTVRFITGNRNVLKTGDRIVKERLETKLDRVMDEIASALIASPVVANATRPPVIAVTPAVNTNFVNLNANSFVSMLRAKIARRAAGKVQFTMPGVMQGADYYLTGEFIAESIKTEGMINLVDYITLMEERLKAGKPMDITDIVKTRTDTTGNDSNYSSSSLEYENYKTLLSELERCSSLRIPPDVNKHLNVMLIKADTKVSVFEDMFALEKKAPARLANADFILSGEITSVSRRVGGGQENYVVVTFILVEPESGEEIWTGSFETKKKTQLGVVY